MPLRENGRLGLRSMEGNNSARFSHPERRHLTVMFCDLVGSTALAQSLDPEDLIDVHRLYRNACTRIIEDHGGHLSRTLADGTFALFGYPAADENNAERATHAALAIIDAVSALEYPHDSSLQLVARIGIATGLVVAGDVIGEGSSRDEAIFGETPNLANRLQTLASPGTVVISDATQKLLRRAFEYRSLGEHQLRGFDQPVQAWQVLRSSDAETRFDAAQISNMVAFVNRCAEIKAMHRLWEEAKSTSSRVLLMTGEAGIGKSRLAKAMRERIAEEPNITRQVQCSPHHQYTALYPFIRYLERVAGLEREDTIDTKREKLRALAGDEALPAYERVLSLSGLPEGDNIVAFSPKRQRDLVFATVLRRLRELADDRPVLLVVEDVHWMDPTSIELLTLLIDNIADARVLFLVTYRPGFSPPWLDRPNVSRMVLDALDRTSGEVLAKAVLGEKASSEIVAQIIDRTDGMPLFIEELAKSLAESGALDTKPRRRQTPEARLTHAIPISLMDSLMARIDSLGKTKAIAQIGAVIGQEFPESLLTHVVADEAPSLESALTHLVSSGLLLRQDSKDEVRYAFKHALVRDAAYDSLLHRRRAALHARIATCIEDHFPETVATEPERLAAHYAEAGLTERAIRYWRRAGERASERSENVEAQNHFQNGLRLLDDLDEGQVRKELELSLLIGLGPVEIAIGGPGSKGTAEAYDRAVALCAELPSSPLHFAAHWGQWRTSRTYLIKGERADRLSAVTSGLGDPGLSLQAHHCQWAVLFNLGSHERCCDHVEQGIRLYEAGDYRAHALIYGGHDPAVCGHGQIALSHWLLGSPDQALIRIDRAFGVAGSLSHAGSELHALEIGLMLHRFRQDVDEVDRLAERMIALSREEQFRALELKGALFRHWCLGRRGDPEAAVAGLTEGIDKLRAIDASEDLPFFFDMLAECAALGGRTDDGLAAIQHALQEVEKTASRFWAAELLRHKGELLLRTTGHHERDVRDAFDQALTTAREQKASMLELRTATSYARWLATQGDRTAARDLLTPVCRQFDQRSVTADVTAARTCLAELEASSGKR
ncbi:MAG: adenylate/guanylate cyclase domain-containing protein [Alphaproteobacteria bacterium]